MLPPATLGSDTTRRPGLFGPPGPGRPLGDDDGSGFERQPLRQDERLRNRFELLRPLLAGRQRSQGRSGRAGRAATPRTSHGSRSDESGGQPGAALAPATGENGTAGLRRHAVTEPVPLGTLPVIRLEGTLHHFSLSTWHLATGPAGPGRNPSRLGMWHLEGKPAGQGRYRDSKSTLRTVDNPLRSAYVVMVRCLLRGTPRTRGLVDGRTVAPAP